MLEDSTISGDIGAEHVRDVSARRISASGLAEAQTVMPAVILGLVTSQS